MSLRSQEKSVKMLSGSNFKIPSKFSESFQMNEICMESRVECAECDGQLDASVSAERRTETARAPGVPTDEIRWTQLGGPSKMSRDPIFHSSSCTTGPFQSNSIRRESTSPGRNDVTGANPVEWQSVTRSVPKWRAVGLLELTKHPPEFTRSTPDVMTGPAELT